MTEAIPLNSQEIKDSLAVARELIEAGIPIFAAAPCPAAAGGTCDRVGHTGAEEFHLPAKWQLTVPSAVWLDRWQPGWALAMVGGHRADVLDVDPRHGGDASAREMQAAGQWPRTYGRQQTPSGGEHYLISPTGEREVNGFLPGLDLQSGTEDGQGRGFAWIAPTVKRSKGTDAGTRRPYRWLDVPDLALLADFAGSDDSIEGVRTRVQAYRARRRAAPDRQPAAGESQLFVGQSAARAAAAGADPDRREFTAEEARAFCEPALARLRAAPLGSIEERCNAAAVQLAHFVPAVLTVDAGMQLLREGLASTAYDEAHPASAWTVEKFRAVLDGRRPPADGWKAVPRAEGTNGVQQGATTPAHTPELAASDAVEALLAEMLTLEEVQARPAPRALIKGLLALDSIAWIIGAPGSKKSFVALDMAMRVAAGQPWQGLKVPAAHPVVVIAAEGAGGLSKRVRAWEALNGPLPGRVHVLPRPVQAAEISAWAVLVEACRRLEPGLVIADTQARVTVGLDENDAKEMGTFVVAVDAIRRATGACVLSVHHTGRKGGDARGSSAIDGAQDTELKVERTGGDRSLTGRLLVEKQKDLEEREPIPLLFRQLQVGVDEDGDALTSLALVADPYAADAAAATPDAAREEAWEVGLAVAIVQLFKVLRDQGGTKGLTKAEARTAVVERFYDNDAKRLNRSTWYSAWTRGRERETPAGDPIMVNVAGERWIVDSDALQSLPAREE